jgi:2-iminobutanoate/2-iminopropanoate deaminase
MLLRIPDGGDTVTPKKVIVADNAPKAIGPYSAGIRVNNFVFTAGQLGIDPDSGELVHGGIEMQTRQALLNLKCILEAEGLSLDNVVKTTVFLQDINEFGRMNGVYKEFFSDEYPARSAVQVAALPKGAAVEIEAIAIFE